ncbi:MAG TPA: gliding motility-associated ABC transporter substrate-binding protein GldG, partial [Cytophagales bacterium]|nr:gliding motility-associated ABC transporter substrate-binding protein GldG [Cytophagales bacterium]
MVNMDSQRLTAWLWLGIVLTSVVLVNTLGQRYFRRIDLTEEGRYSISDPTKRMLRELEDVVYVDVYLDGDMPAGFERLKRSIRETLEEFRVHAGTRIQYQFIDPWAGPSGNARQEFFRDLGQKGLQPINVVDDNGDQTTEKYLVPGAVISYAGSEIGVMLLQTSLTASPDEQLNQSVEGVEYALASTIGKLTAVERKTVGILRGHGELSGLNITGVVSPLEEFYNMVPVQASATKEFQSLDALIVAKPVEAFTEQEKYNLDQYLMQGGKVFMALDLMEVYMDSAGGEGTASIPYNLNLEDQLFRYGLRINYDLVGDAQSGYYPAVVSEAGGQPQIRQMPWP